MSPWRRRLRRVLRASVLAVWLCSIAGVVGAQVVTRGPYLQLGSDSSMTIRWRTSSPTESTVHYGTDSGKLSLSASSPTPVSEHEIALSSLSPETRYYYAISSGGSVLAGGDSSTFFETSPAPGSVSATRIWVVGDSGTADQYAAAVYDAYRGFADGIPADLWLMLGDNAYNDGSDARYQAALFDMYPEVLRQTPVWPAFGNHDAMSASSNTQTGPYFDIFSLPTAGQLGGEPSGTEAYYSFDYANAHFVVLDSSDSNLATTAAMHAWLEADLQAMDAQDRSDWLIALFHHPPYSKGSHDSDTAPPMIAMRENFLPLLEAYGVDLVMAGHSHDYERSMLIDGHYGSSSTFGPAYTVDGGDGRPAGDGPYEKPSPRHGANEGAVYMVAGSSGKVGGGTFDHPVMVESLRDLGSVVIDLNGAELSARFLSWQGTVRDEFTIQKGAAPTSSSVAGRVWHDADGDGVRQAGEPTLADVPVSLELASGVPVASTITDAAGGYAFSGLNAGEFTVKLAPGALVFTPPDQGADPTVDSNFDPATGAASLTLLESQARTDLDAGLLDPAPTAPPYVDLSFANLEPYPGLDTQEGEVGSTDGGLGLQALGSRWMQTLTRYDVTPGTTLAFELRSEALGAPSAIGFDDDGDPTTGLRLLDLGGTRAPDTVAIPQSYEEEGGWQTYRIPVGELFTGTGLHLVLGVTTPNGEPQAETSVRYVEVPEPGAVLGLLAGIAVLALLAPGRSTARADAARA